MVLDYRYNGDFDYRYVEEFCEIKPADELRRLIGVSEDKESGSIIVTYRHIIERYRLSKIEPFHVKVGEWTTKYNLTSAVVYDGTLDKYMAVFHGDTVRVWGHETRDLTKTEKFTFRMPVLKILIRPEKVSLIIFRNGDCVTLPHGMEHCATFRRKALVKENTVICDINTFTRRETDYVCYVADDKNDCYLLITIPIIDEVADTSKVSTLKVSKIREGKEGVKITGIKLVVLAKVNPFLYITWNDYRLSKYDLIRKRWRHKAHAYRFQNDVTMSCVGKNYIFIYTKRSRSPPNMSVRHGYCGGTTQWYKNEAGSHSVNTQAILCNTADFMVVADRDKITLLNVEFDPESRLPHWRRDDMIDKLIEKLRTPEEYFPIFGYTEISKFKRTSGNI